VVDIGGGSRTDLVGGEDRASSRTADAVLGRRRERIYPVHRRFVTGRGFDAGIVGRRNVNVASDVDGGILDEVGGVDGRLVPERAAADFGRADQGIDSVEQQVLRLPADRVERQNETIHGARAVR